MELTASLQLTVNLNLANTTYLAASTVDQYKSKLRTISAAAEILSTGRY